MLLLLLVGYRATPSPPTAPPLLAPRATVQAAMPTATARADQPPTATVQARN